MLKVWRWDEIEGDVDRADLPHVEEDSPPHLVVAANDDLCDIEPGEYSRWVFTDFPTFRLVTGRWGRDKQYMIWWGEEAACQKFADLLDPH